MRYWPVIALLFICSSAIQAQEFTVMFYNTENLFDTSDDTLKDDAEFLPDGLRRWTNTRYRAKLDAVSRVIAAAAGWEAPLFVGLCEVENKTVALDLSKRPLLFPLKYDVIHRESPDTRGIDLCLLYRRDMAKVTEVRSWVPIMEDGEQFTSRNILYVKTLVFGDTLHLILCHFPSRRGGTLASESIRQKMFSLLSSKVDSLFLQGTSKPWVVIMGDLNTTPDDQVINKILKERGLVNLTSEKEKVGAGSYRFAGRWEMIDQIIVSGPMTDTLSVFTTNAGRFSVVDLPFLLEDDPDYPGKRPLSTFRGFSWSEGYSDHLPVTASITHH